MILVDFNQVMISNLMMQLGNHTDAELNTDLLRHMVLNSLRSYRVKFAAQYGEMVIACDDRQNWRRDFFPYYKANRKKARDASELDWNMIFESFTQIRNEIKEFLPYPVIAVPLAEADDIIGTLVQYMKSELTPGSLVNSKIVMILSGDKDFIQLHTADVKQYDPTRKKAIEHDSPQLFLLEHIIKGDRGDGVPNILSDDNCLVLGKRQAAIRETKMPEYINMIKTGVFPSANLERNYKRNATVIDLKNTPISIRDAIEAEYLQQQGKKRDKIFNYFIKYKLRNMMEVLNDF